MTDIEREPLLLGHVFCRATVIEQMKRIVDLAQSEARELTDAEHFTYQGWLEIVEAMDAVGAKFMEAIQAINTFKAEQLSLFQKVAAANAIGEKVYFQTDGEFVKIGRTIRPEHKRRKENQTGNARALITLVVIPRASEAKVKARFKSFHVRGEWYSMAPEIMEFIRAWQLVEVVFE